MTSVKSYYCAPPRKVTVRRLDSDKTMSPGHRPLAGKIEPHPASEITPRPSERALAGCAQATDPRPPRLGRRQAWACTSFITPCTPTSSVVSMPASPVCGGCFAPLASRPPCTPSPGRPFRILVPRAHPHVATIALVAGCCARRGMR
jgi:hypothetical protein